MYESLKNIQTIHYMKTCPIMCEAKLNKLILCLNAEMVLQRTLLSGNELQTILLNYEFQIFIILQLNKTEIIVEFIIMQFK